MEPHTSPDVLLAGLQATAAEFVVLLEGVDAETWRRRPAPGEWSPTEIMCHLRDVEREVHLDRLKRVAEQENTFLAAADPDPLAETRDYQAQDGSAALREFLKEREALIAFVRDLPRPVWERTARHALFGTTRFSELVSLMIDHDRAHIEQVRQALAA